MCVSEDFEREKTCYEQNFQQARNLNSQINQVPVLSMTLTGGLWFAAGVTDNIDPEIRCLLLIFAGFCNLSLTLVTIRVRDVFHSYLESIQGFYSAGFASGTPHRPMVPILGDYSMVSIYCALMCLAAVFSFGAAILKFWPLELLPAWGGAILLLLIITALYYVLIGRAVQKPSATRDKSVQENEER